MRVLILSTLEDIHAKSVNEHLINLGVEVDFFRFEELLQSCTSVFRFGAATNVCLIEGARKSIDLRAYSSIWYRRPGGIVALQQFPEPWIGKMVEQEARHAIDGMLLSLDCLWMNHPRKDFQCLQKLWQLQVAIQEGLSIPETVVTSDPQVAKEFFVSCNEQVIYKLIGGASNFSIPAYEQPRGIPTLPLRQADFEYLDQVRFAPHFFQKRIEKRVELRVTIVGQKVFTIEIDSQAGDGKVDWRNDYSVKMTPYDLPEEIETKCKTLMKRLGLNYGALDFCLTPDDQYIFLEINCAGQYMWIEQRTELPISAEIANLLAGKTEPLVHPVLL